MNLRILKMLALCALLLLSIMGYTQPLTPPASTKPIHIVIQGLGGEALKNVRQKLNEDEAGLDGNYTQQGMGRFYRQLRENIRSAIEPYGYFRAQIHTRMNYSQGEWYIYITINPGEQLKFTQIDLQITGPGADDPAYQQLYTHLPTKAGEPFNSDKYNQAREDLFDIAANRGYFDNKILKNQLIVNLDNYTSTVVLHFYTGPRYFFGTTRFNKTPFRESFLRRFLNYRAGEPYEARVLDSSREGFASSAYFQQVIATPQITGIKDRHIPVDFTLIPQAKKQYTLGLGYGTNTGVRALAAMTYNWINSYGHRFDTLVRASQIDDELTAHYYIPGHHPAQDQYVITAGAAHESFTTGKSNSVTFGGSYQTIFDGWQMIASLSYLNEHSQFPTLPGSPTVNADLVYPNITLDKRVANDQLNPSKGYYVLLNLAGANDEVLSKISFGQARLTLKTLYTFFNRLRVIIRGTGGITDIDEIQNLPLTLQFYAGGTESIRGYVFNQFGPGRYLFTSTFELQEKIVGNWYAVGFVDAGNATNTFQWRLLNVGVGPGIAWSSPIGLLELTVGNAITSKGRPWVIQFTMGPAL